MRTFGRHGADLARCHITATEQERSDAAARAALDGARASGASRKLRAIMAHAHDVLIREAAVQPGIPRRPRR